MEESQLRKEKLYGSSLSGHGVCQDDANGTGCLFDDLLLVWGEVTKLHHYEFYRTGQLDQMDYFSIILRGWILPESSNNETMQGGKEDSTMTKVVDQRWYERNKHIFPASIWTDFNRNVDYEGMVKRYLGGDTFFFG
jgi:protein FAM50